jgi:hypothetical protein
MKRLREFLVRLPGGHRPPTGPLTTDEQTDADERQNAKEDERIEPEQEESDEGDRRDREV